MKYETPELTALTPAINVIQSAKQTSGHDSDTPQNEPPTSAYQDWED
jgi:hypothetical protein